MNRYHRQTLACFSSLVLGAAVIASPTADALPVAEQDIFIGLDAETQAAVGAELDACPTCSLELLADGTPNVVQTTAEPTVGVAEAQAAPLVFVADGRTATSCVDSADSIAKESSYERTLGNSLAGVFWRTRSSSGSVPFNSNSARRYTAHAEQAVGGKLLNFTFDVARAEGDALAETTGTRRLTGRLLRRSLSTGAMTTVATRTSTTGGAVTLAAISTTDTYWGGSKTFTIGPVPVNVATYLRGQASHKVNGNTASSEAAVTGNPNASLYVDASASVEVVVAAVGADAQLTLLSGAVPTSARMSRTSSDYSWNLSSNAVFTALSGYVKAWVRIGYWKLSKTWRHTIASWSGFTWNQSLFSDAGSKPRCGVVVAADTGTVATR